MFCGRHNLPLRGHRESSDSKNPGIFKSLLQFHVDSGDEVLRHHFQSGARNAQYTSKGIQNELIKIIGNNLQSILLGKIKNGSKIFSILADESRDCANQEQLSLVVRYVNESNEIEESFLAFVKCDSGTTGEALATLIEDTCKSLSLDLSLCRGQGYDGASNMCGKSKGVSSVLLAKFPKALYFHCASHKLNLCVVKACKLSSVANMMDAVSCLANFFNYSPQRQQHFEDNVHKFCPVSLKSKLLPLCRTRWVERLDALDVTISLMEAINATLLSMAGHTEKTWNRDTTSQASSLLKRIDFEFLVNLIVTQKVLAFTSGLTEGLQKRGIDLMQTFQYSNHVIQTLESIREKVDLHHRDWFESAANVANKLDVEVSITFAH